MGQVRLKTTNILKLNRRKNTHKKWKRAKLILQFNSSDLLSSSFLITGPSGSAGDSTSTKSINENSNAVHTFTANENVTWSLSSASISNTENFFKSGEVKDGGLGDIVLTFKTQAENPLLDVGGNTDGTKGFIDIYTYSYDSSQDKFTQIDASGQQNGYDYRGNTTTRSRQYWIDEWNGTDSLRFDYKYINSSGTEYLDHYYLELIDKTFTFSNTATNSSLLGIKDINETDSGLDNITGYQLLRFTGEEATSFRPNWQHQHD